MAHSLKAAAGAVACAALLTIFAASAHAQTSSSTSTSSTASTASPPAGTGQRTDTRPLTPTVSGDTGIWFVPTGIVLPSRSWSISAANWNIDDGQGFSDFNRLLVNFAVGLGDWAEVFGNWNLVTRIDRDTVPLFFTSTAKEVTTGTGGGIHPDYPLVRGGWTGSKLGDLWVGGKVNFLTGRELPFAVAGRAQVKLPVGDDEVGVSSGEMDFQFDGVVSYATSMFEASGFVGYLVRGNPEGYTLTNGLKWGAGVALFNIYNSGIRVSAELYGERYRNLTIIAPPSFGDDGSAVPSETNLRDPAILALGVTWHAANGFFIGGGVSTNLNMKGRHEAEGFGVGPFVDHGIGDRSAFNIRIGWAPARRPIYRSASAALAQPTGVPTTAGKPQPQAGAAATTQPPGAAVPPPTGAAVPPPTGAAVPPPTGAAVPPPTGAAVPPPVVAGAAAANRAPTVQVHCDPCTIQAGRTVTVWADAKDPDGNPLTYRWSADTGTLQNPTANKTSWTAGNRLGPNLIRVAVDDGRGGIADGAATVVVTAVDLQNLGTVHFDFDKSELRPDAIAILNDAIESLKSNPTMLIEIEGHACDIGTTEYNFALGERRAASVRSYLTSRGIAANRLRIISYGEERPKHDNSTEETKKLNRRAELVVRR